MPDDPAAIPGATPSNYQRTAGGSLQWKAPTVERLQQMLAGYEVIEILGMGGMGAVYKARQISLDRLVAIKILPPEAAGDADANFVERFKNEARTMAKMNHPGIVHVYDFGETSEGQLYIVMEFIDGTDVSKMLLSQGRLPPDHALAIVAHVCDALQYAHTHGVVHRDIKPANVLINREGAVKVVDFGLAKGTDAGQVGLTKTSMAMGTPDFVAPEALIAGMIVDGRADLYAVGVMLYQMLTGNVPRGAFRMPSTTVKTDARFDKIIVKAMEMDREMRYQTAFDLRKDLDVILITPVEPGLQSSDAVPAQAVGQKTMAKGPEDKSANVPVRSVSRADAVVAGSRAPGPPAPPSRVTKPKSKASDVVIGVATVAMIAAGLFFAFKASQHATTTETVPEPVSPAPVAATRDKNSAANEGKNASQTHASFVGTWSGPRGMKTFIINQDHNALRIDKEGEKVNGKWTLNQDGEFEINWEDHTRLVGNVSADGQTVSNGKGALWTRKQP